MTETPKFSVSGEEFIDNLLEENKKLREFKTKREESMFYFKALAERAEPINSKEAEELQKYKKLFERLYREELYYLEEENKKLKEERDNCLKEVKLCYNDIHSLEGQISDLEEENNRLKDNAMEDMRVQTKLEEENKTLKEKVRFLEECLDRKEKVNKSLREELSAYDREYFDEDKKAEHIFMEEDTLQELRDIGEI